MTTHAHGKRRSPASAPVAVTCDACGDTWPTDRLIVHKRYAVCPVCIETVRAVDQADAEHALEDAGYAIQRRALEHELVATEGPYTESAQAVRRRLGLK